MVEKTIQVVVVLVVVGGVFTGWLRLGRASMGRRLPAPLPMGRRSNFMEGRQVLVYGKLGAGKTAMVMQRAVKFARRHRLPLIANAPVREDAIVLRSWDDLAALPLCSTTAAELEARRELLEGLEPRVIEDWLNRSTPCVNATSDWGCPGCTPGVLVLDEVHLWLPSQNGLMPTEVVRSAIHLLSYARKRGWLIFATTQYPTRVSTQFRYLCTEMIEVRAFSQGIVHYCRTIDPDTGKQILGFAGMFFPRRARYNHRAEVEPLWSTDAARRPSRAR